MLEIHLRAGFMYITRLFSSHRTNKGIFMTQMERGPCLRTARAFVFGY